MFNVLLIPNNVIGQNDFNYDLKTTPNINISVIEADSIMNNISTDTLKTIKKAFQLSRSFYKKNNLKLAIKYAKLQNELSRKSNSFLKHYHNSYFLIGTYHLRNQNLDSAITYFKNALNLNYYPKKVAQSYCLLGSCYSMQGKLYKSLDYYQKGLDLLVLQGNKYSLVINSYNFSSTCNQIKTKESGLLGIKYLKKSDSIIKTDYELKNIVERGYLYNNLANLYQIKDIYSFKNAYHYYKEALKIGLKLDDYNLIATSYVNIGELLLKEENDNALKYFKLSLKYNKKTKDTYKKTTDSENYRNISKCFVLKSNIDSALVNINRSLKSSFEIPFENDLKLTESHFEKVISRRNVMLAFKGKVDILYQLFLKTKDSKYLHQIITTVEVSDNFINYTIQNSTEKNTQFLWRDDVSEIYNYGVLAAYKLNDSSLMHSIIEKNKAFLLTQSIKENNNLLQLPNEINQQLKTYKKQILALEEKTSGKSFALKDSLFTLKFNYENFRDSIAKVYPEYFSKKNNINPISLARTKSNLNENDVLLSFHVDQENKKLFGLFIGKQDEYSFKKELTPDFNSLIISYKKLISKPLQSKTGLDTFYKTSSELFEFLFPSEEAKKFIQNKNLIIVSNGILQNIPFEALNTSEKGLRYLIEDHNISYAYSASFLDFNNSVKRTSSKNIAAFAPVSFSNSTLKPLESTASEVQTIDNEIDTDLFINEDASKANFLTQSSDYNVLHLATHATASENPAIYFSNDTLQLHELYTHKTNADLVVLSACQTNLGELKKGEGVFSLSRGFFYSGTKAVVSSLWNVNDASTSGIMKDFYANLNKHQSKSEAINNAKRNYIKTHSLSEKSPYYWASFVLIGDTSPTYPKTPYLLYLLGFIAISTVILFFFKKRG